MGNDILIKQSELVKNIPEGFDIDSVICTTMSIDPSVMIQTIFQIGYPSLSKVKMSQVDTVLGCESRFKFFYDSKEYINFENDSCIAGVLADSSIFALENMAISVEHKGPIFHPKIVLIKFKNKQGKRYYRIMVSSKNLTSTYSYEVGVILESKECVPEKCNHNLSDFLNFLLNSTEDEKIKSIAEEINDYQFALLNDECQDRKVNIKFSGCEDGLGKQDKLLETLKSKKNTMLILSPSYETEQGKIDNYFVYEPKHEKTHAKLYYSTEDKFLWIGSSNLSDGGLKNNVECMVELDKAEEITKEDENNITVFGTPCIRVKTATEFEVNVALEKLNQFLREHSFNCEVGKICIKSESVVTEEQYNGCSFFVKLYDWNPKDEEAWTSIDHNEANNSFDRKGKSDFLLVGCAYKGTQNGKIQTAKKMIPLKSIEDAEILKEAFAESLKKLLETPWFYLAQKNDASMYEYGMRVGHELINNKKITEEQKSEIQTLLELMKHYYQKEFKQEN